MSGFPSSPPALSPPTIGSSPRTDASSSRAARWNASDEPNGYTAGEPGAVGRCDMLRRRPKICVEEGTVSSERH